MMNNGDSLMELRAWRDEFARAHGYDVHAMAAALRALDISAGREVIHGKPRQPLVTQILNQTLPPTKPAILIPETSIAPEAAPTAEI